MEVERKCALSRDHTNNYNDDVDETNDRALNLLILSAVAAAAAAAARENKFQFEICTFVSCDDQPFFRFNNDILS